MPNVQNKEEAKHEIDMLFAYVKTYLKTNLGLEITVKMEFGFESIYQLLDYNKNILNKIDEDSFDEFVKLITYNITIKNHVEVESLLENFINNIKDQHIHYIKNITGKLIDIILLQLPKMGFAINENLVKSSLECLNDINDISSLITYTNNLISEITNVNQEIAPSIIMINKVKQYIETNYQNDISLQDIADYVFLNAKYLSQLFKKQTNENLSDYLLKTRMNKAIELLKGNTKFEKVATLTGFKTHKYFTKVFKQYTGFTPKEYKLRFER